MQRADFFSDLFRHSSLRQVTSSPVHFTSTPTAISLPPPLLGEHTQAVLQRVLGMSVEELRKLERDGVVGAYDKIQ
jgi:crotonobetainyl-CoA:carnitine CoA-transferase CaiB-like acyl-CoA transferase